MTDANKNWAVFLDHINLPECATHFVNARSEPISWASRPDEKIEEFLRTCNVTDPEDITTIIYNLRNLPVAPLKQKFELDETIFPNLAKFWNCITKSSISNQILYLPPDIYFLGDRHYPQKLIIRQVYSDIIANIQSSVQSGLYHRFTITGTPGIGKSYFLLYLLYVLHLKNATIVMKHNVDREFLVFEGNNASITPYYENVTSLLANPDTWYLLDTESPTQVPAITILVCSPSPKIYKEFRKMLNSTIRYMPPWTWEEIVKCRDALYTGINDDKLTTLYDHWGGIPRYVLEKCDDPSQDALLEKAIASADLEKCLWSIGEHKSPEDISHRILHIVTSNYTLTAMKYASPYVAQEIATRFALQQHESLHRFLVASDGDSMTSSLCGQLFEGYVHNMLKNGGNFDIRKIDEDTVSSIRFANRTQRLYRTLSNIDPKIDDYWRPIARNFLTFNSLIPTVGLFQITISLHHGAKMAVLEEWKKIVGHRKFVLYFVVPESIFEKF
ncbi:7163_t:CDS:2, partial [Paraglomus brasilianum]